MGIKITAPIADVLKQFRFDEEFKKTVFASAYIREFLKKEGAVSISPLDNQIVNNLKKRYANLDLEILIALWVENYEMLHAVNKFTKNRESASSILLKNKISALGEIIYKKHTVKK